MALKIYTKDNYFFIVEADNKIREGHSRNVLVRKKNTDSTIYFIDNVNGWRPHVEILLTDIQKENGDPYTEQEWIDFYTLNTGFNCPQAGGQAIIRASSIVTQPITNVATTFSFDNITMDESIEYDPIEETFTFLKAAKINIILNVNIVAGAPALELHLWDEAWFGGQFIIVPSSSKRVNFGSKTEGSINFARIAFANVGDIFKVRHQLESGTANFISQDFVNSDGNTLTIKSVELGVFQID